MRMVLKRLTSCSHVWSSLDNKLLAFRFSAAPDVWSKTVFLQMYDENDALFDHVPDARVPRLDARSQVWELDVERQRWWYDVSIASGDCTRRYAGRLETGARQQ